MVSTAKAPFLCPGTTTTFYRHRENLFVFFLVWVRISVCVCFSISFCSPPPAGWFSISFQSNRSIFERSIYSLFFSMSMATLPDVLSRVSSCEIRFRMMVTAISRRETQQGGGQPANANRKRRRKE